MTLIHPTAVIDPKAELDSSVKVGAYTVIGPNVQIGANTEIGPHTVINGHTTIGENNRIFQFASLGEIPQDKKYRDEPTKLIIGNGYTLVFQFCQIGDYAMTAFAAGVHKDVPPYFMAAGYRAEPAGINSEGMRRNGFTAEQIAAVKDVYKTIYHRGIPFEEAKADILRRAETQAELAVFKDFFAQSTRGIIR